jgi:DNA-binding transcriptional regulator YdaS (Cro superfamily)
MTDFRIHIEAAVQLKGSQLKLAEAAGCSQQHISYLLHEAVGISAEMAAAIDHATGGQIPRARLRPDLFSAPSQGGARTQGGAGAQGGAHTQGGAA